MADIRTSCPTKLCYLQKSGSVGISSYQFIYSNPYILSRCRVNVLPISRIYSDNPCASVYFQGPTPSPLTQTPSTPKHTNPIQQSSRNRKAVISSRQKNPTKTKTLPAFFFFSSLLLLSKRHPHQCCVSLLHTARHTTLSPGWPPDSVRSRSPGVLSCK